MKPQPAPGLVADNLAPLLGWVVMAGFLAAVATLGWVLHRDGTEPGHPPWLQTGALALLWVGGMTAGGHLFGTPCTRLRVAPGGAAVLTRVWPLWWRREHLPRGAIAGVAVRQGHDSEGDPYFRTLLVLADGREWLVTEGHHAPAQRAIAARLRAAIGLPPLDATRADG
ncbi:MAG: hypothetical protein K2X49_22775 [Acetobacteraceae bacterium]|nr:hypothetical protein [Acetobacteraceae bacterium]